MSDLVLSILFQCAMCKTTAEAGGEASLAQGLSLGILILLVPPAVIFCAFFWMAYKSESVRAGGPADTLPPADGDV